MENRKTLATIIVLLNGNSVNDNKFIKEWLNKIPFVTNETTDVFQVLEAISDFTTHARPDVVLLEVDSLKRDFLIVQSMMQTFSDDVDFPILALSDSGNIVNDKRCFEGNLAEVQARITEVLPKTLANTAV